MEKGPSPEVPISGPGPVRISWSGLGFLYESSLTRSLLQTRPLIRLGLGMGTWLTRWRTNSDLFLVGQVSFLKRLSWIRFFRFVCAVAQIGQLQILVSQLAGFAAKRLSFLVGFTYLFYCSFYVCGMHPIFKIVIGIIPHWKLQT